MPDPLGLGPLAADLRARLDWREELLSLALIVAESAIVYLVAGALLPEIPAPYAPVPAWLLFGLLAAGYYLPHWLDEARVWGARYEAILAIGVVATLLVALKIAAFPEAPWLSAAWLRGTVDGFILRPNAAVRPPWTIVALVAYAWWRGRTRAEPMLETAYQMLRWGTLALAGGLVLALAVTPRDAPLHARLPAAVVVYFAAALAAVGIARLRLEGLRSGSPLGPHWLATFAVPIGGIVLVAILVAGILSRPVLDALLVVLSPVFWLVGLVVRALILVIALLAFLIMTPLLWLIERTGIGDLPLLSRLPRETSPLEQVEAFARDTLHVADPVRYLVAGLVLFFLVSALIRYLHRRHRRWREHAEERRESVFAWDEAVGGLTARIRRVLRPAPRPGDLLARLRGDPRWAHTLAIRETYIRLLRRAARAGAPRPPGATPDEHQPAIAAHLPEAAEEVATITAAYDSARYGPDPATPEQAEAVRRAWRRLAARRPPRR